MSDERNFTEEETRFRTKEITLSKKFNENLRRCDGEPCIICGKAVTNVKFSAHVVEGGFSILHPDDEEKFWEIATRGDLSDDCGIQPVGPDCARKYKGWLHKEAK